MTSPHERQDAMRRLHAFASLDLSGFDGLRAGTSKSHLEEAFGPSDAGVMGRLGYETLWFRVFPLAQRDQLTAWFQDEKTSDVLYLERPVDPEIRAWLDGLAPELHRPPHSRLTVALPARGLAVLYSGRSRRPVLAYAFVPLSEEEFDDCHLAFLG